MPEHTGPGHGTCSRRSMQRVPAGPRPLRAGWHRGGRNDLGSAPSVDIANGAPTAADATDQIVLTWVDGRDGLNHEHVMFTTSTDVGGTWAPFRQLEQPGDQGYYSAPAISPDGTDVYLVYNAFTTPFRNNTTEARWLVGVVLHAEVAGGVVGTFTQMHRGAVGDPRSSAQNNLAGEFLGDTCTRQRPVRTASPCGTMPATAVVCSAINTYRQALHDAVVAGTALPTGPAVLSSCPGDVRGQRYLRLVGSCPNAGRREP